MRPLILIAVLALTACERPFSPDAGVPLPVTRLAADDSTFLQFSGFRQPARLVIQDDAAWAAAWQTMWERHGSPPPRPEVDFTRDMIILAALGEQVSGGFGVRVDAATRNAEAVTVLVKRVVPAPPCLVVTVLTQPVDVARLPRSPLPVRFEERTETRGC